MQSNYIATLYNIRFPRNDRFDFRKICQSVFDRYYQTFVARLQASGYEFPPNPRYLEQFGHRLPASFICTREGGLIFDPGVAGRCLVFINGGEDTHARVYTARCVVHKGEELELFGEGPYSISVKLIDDVTAVVIVVPSDDIDGLTSEGVTRM